MSSHEPWKHAYAHVNNIRLHYVTAGDGPLMVMLHGFPEFWYSWRHQIPAMAESYRVVAPDMRGYNQSEKPVGVSHYRLGALMEDIQGLIHHLGESSAVLVAHDWGGGVAWPFAAYYPQMVDRLIILNCPPPAVLMRHLMGNRAQLRRSYYMFLFQLPLLPEAVMRARDYELIERAFRGWAIDKSAFSDHDIAMFKEAAAKPGALTGGINYYRAAFRGFLRSPRLSESSEAKVRCPTLVIWGEEDKALGKELSDDFHTEVDGPLEIEFISNCSHWVQQEQPRRVNALIADFLARYLDS
ncbi:MAG: alpha/beta hydrolase [Actinobacteria bacterium]|nr:alpha/beta hydrolase [Actinomycetota bacterium]